MAAHRVLDDLEHRRPPDAHQPVPGAEREAHQLGAGVGRRQELADVAGAEGEEVADLPAVDIDDLEPLPGPHVDPPAVPAPDQEFAHVPVRFFTPSSPDLSGRLGVFGTRTEIDVMRHTIASFAR